eukprot:PhF_6_TR10382/c0_g1_i1/m.16184/K02335/DPO1, polA; DNA polymerase I
MLRRFSFQFSAKKAFALTNPAKMSKFELMQYCTLHNLRFQANKINDVRAAVALHMEQVQKKTTKPQSMTMEMLSVVQNRGIEPVSTRIVLSAETTREETMYRVGEKNVASKIGLDTQVMTLSGCQTHVYASFGKSMTVTIALSVPTDMIADHIADFIKQKFSHKNIFVMPLSNNVGSVLQTLQKRYPEILVFENVNTLFRRVSYGHRRVAFGWLPTTVAEGLDFFNVPHPATMTQTDNVELAHDMLRAFEQHFLKTPNMLNCLFEAYDVVLFSMSASHGSVFLPLSGETKVFEGANVKQVASFAIQWLLERKKSANTYNSRYLIITSCLTEHNGLSKIKPTYKYVYDVVNVQALPLLEWMTNKPLADVWAQWTYTVGGNDIYGKVRRLAVSALNLRKFVGTALYTKENNNSSPNDVKDRSQHIVLPESKVRFEVVPEKIGNETRQERERMALEENNRFVCIVAHGQGNVSSLTHTAVITHDVPDFDSFDVLVAHDIKYILTLLPRDAIQKFVSRGGRVWCTQYAEYLLRGHDVEHTSTEDILKRYISSQFQEKESCGMFAAVDDDKRKSCADLLRLETVFRAQQLQAVEKTMLILINSLMNVNVLLSNIESAGIYVDKHVAQTLLKSLQKEHDKVAKQLLSTVPESARENFNWQNDAQLQKWLCGGQISGSSINEDFTMDLPLNPTAAVTIAIEANALKESHRQYLERYAKFHKLSEKGDLFQTVKKHVHAAGGFSKFRFAVLSVTSADLESVTSFSLLDTSSGSELELPLSTEWNWILLSINSPHFTQPMMYRHHETFRQSNVYFADVSQCIPLLAAMPSLTAAPTRDMETNKLLWQTLLNQPKSICELLAKNLEQSNDAFLVRPSMLQIREQFSGILPQELKANYQRGRITMDELRVHENSIPEIKAYFRFKELEKVMGLYEGEPNGILVVAGNDNTIHSKFSPKVSRTGRLVSSKPNVTSIPKDNMRKSFRSRFEGGKIVEFDYTQLEIRSLALLCQDPTFLLHLEQNIDFHCQNVTALRTDLNYEQVLHLAKVVRDPAIVKLRDQAKVFVFQRMYGASVGTLAATSGLSVKQIEALLALEQSKYPGIQAYVDNFEKQVRIYQPNAQVPKATMQGDWIYRGVGQTQTGSRYMFEEASSHGRAPSFVSTQMRNYPVQGLASEIVITAAIEVMKTFARKHNYDNKALLVNMVHDSLVIDCQESVAQEVIRDTVAVMSNIPDIFSKVCPELNVTLPFKVDVQMGSSWGELSPVRL